MSERKKVLEEFDFQDAFWRKRVEDDIERYRKGDANLTLTDEAGNPISNAKVRVKQKTHEFRFGANIFMLDQLETDEKNEKYKKLFADLFNIATLPFYWDTLEPQRGAPRYSKDSEKIYRRPTPDHCIEFCEAHGIEPREHALAFDHFFPDWLADASVEEVKRELERRYSEIAERYADKIHTIEVTNELNWEKGKTAFYDEPDFVEWCFKLAEKYFPNNQLCINEGTMLCWEDRCRVIAKYYSYIEANLLKGARIDAIGLQYHLFIRAEREYEDTRRRLNPERLFRLMDLYSNFGKPLQITEVTVPAYSWNPEDEEIQAEIIEKLYSIWFSHPNVEQIIYWNLVDGYAHAAEPGDMTAGENYYHGGLLRFDLSPKPAYLKVKELIQERWHTETEVLSDETGAIAFRGFYGEYDLEITVDGKNVTRKFNLSSKNANDTNVVIL